jgi:hypothetical protein
MSLHTILVCDHCGKEVRVEIPAGLMVPPSLPTPWITVRSVPGWSSVTDQHGCSPHCAEQLKPIPLPDERLRARYRLLLGPTPDRACRDQSVTTVQPPNDE